MRVPLREAIGIILACTVVSPTGADENSDDETRQHILRSDVIAVGELSFRQVKGTDDYVVLDFTAQRFLKLTVPTKTLLKVRFYDRKKERRDTVKFLKQTAAKSVVIFLVQVDDHAGEEFYLANALRDSIRPTSQSVEKAVARELRLQKNIVQNFKADEGLLHFTEVEALLNSIKDSESQRIAFSKLEALGSDGVSAIIAQMDDFRDLPESAMSLTNPKGHWEGTRHYGPDKMVDALAAILNQITHHSFRSIYNGGSNRERRECINAWRVYDHQNRNENNQIGAGQ